MHTLIEYFLRCLNLYTLCLFIGFAVGFASCYSFVIWPPKRLNRKGFKYKCGVCRHIWTGYTRIDICPKCDTWVKGTKQ